MSDSVYSDIKASLRQLYLDDERPWIVGFSGGKDSTLVAVLIFDAVLSIPADQRKKPVSLVCTDTRVEIPAVVEVVEGARARMNRYHVDERDSMHARKGLHGQRPFILAA